MKKIIALVVTLSLVGAFALSATMAYLTGQTVPVVNAFTVGDINIDLKETGWEQGFKGKIIPGEAIDKDPTITVKKGSEPNYLFVYLKNTLAVSTGAGSWDYVTPNIDADTWILVESKVNADGVKEELYRYKDVVDVSAATDDLKLPFFTTVTVPGETFTKQSMEALAANGLDMTIQAYAHQSANVELPDVITAAKGYFEFPVAP
jgi:hypothetical protein